MKDMPPVIPQTAPLGSSGPMAGRIRTWVASLLASVPVPVLTLVAIALVPLAAINAVGLAQTALWLVRHGGTGGDWEVLRHLTLADPYAVPGYRWSPPAAWIVATLIVPLGLPLWQLLHLPALALIRDWRVIVLALVSWAFWQDLANGNLMVLVLVSAWWTLRDSRAGTVGFLALSVLVPRPLMLPVLAWVLLKKPWARLWFAGIAIVVIAASVASGQMGPWIERLFSTGQSELVTMWNIGPSRLIGAVWIPIGLALAAALAARGWLGLASVVISPYLFPYYMLMALLDVPRLLRAVRRAA